MYALIIQIVIALIQALIQYFANSDLPPAQRNKIALTTFGTSVLGFMASNYATTGSVLGGKIGSDSASKMAADALNFKQNATSSPPGVNGYGEDTRTGVEHRDAANAGDDSNGSSVNGGGRQKDAEKPSIVDSHSAEVKNTPESKVMGASLFDSIIKAGMAAGDNITHVIDAVAPHAGEIIDGVNKRKIINETSKAINSDKIIGLAALLGIAFILFKS